MIRNIIAVLSGCLIGSAVNMGLITIGGKLVPPGEGFDPMNATAWELKYFLFPFLAHAGGTLAGAFTTAKIAASHHMIFAIAIGIFFLMGGMTMVFILPAPVWFIIADLSLAYIPMGWLGWRLSGKE